MCLATVYSNSDDSVIFRNVSCLTVDDDMIVIRDILGEEKKVAGSIVMVDLANSIVKIRCE